MIHLNETAQSIVQISKDNLSSNWLQNAKCSFYLICKWGFDGSSGHSNYKQAFIGRETTDNLFVTALVPLELVNTSINREVWVNSRPGSMFYCRSMKLIFAKEKNSFVTNVHKKIRHKYFGTRKLSQRCYKEK